MTDATPAHGHPALVTHRTQPVRVTYRDTDRMGYAYHSQYLVWFEMGRTELLRSLGTAYKAWEDEEGVYLPVRSVRADYRTPARYDDLVVVETVMVRLTRASVEFEYVIRRAEDGLILAEGGTIHAFVNGEGRVLRVADKLLPNLFAEKR